MKRLMMLAALVGAGLLAMTASPAAAQATRTWVSGVGDDANPCSRTAPCKTFAGAYTKTAAAGEINCIDPGGFGTLTILKSITIICDNVEAGIAANQTYGIIVNAAATDVIFLSGLDIEGYGTGLTGLKVITAKSVTLKNSVVRGFTTAGIEDVGTNAGGFLNIDGVHTQDNANAKGIWAHPPNGGSVGALITNTMANGNSIGVEIDDRGYTTMHNSTASNNTSTGVLASSNPNTAELNLDGSVITGNVTAGIATSGASAKIRISNNVIADNGTGISTPSGTVTSYSPATNANASSGTPNGTAIPLQ